MTCPPYLSARCGPLPPVPPAALVTVAASLVGLGGFAALAAALLYPAAVAAASSGVAAGLARAGGWGVGGTAAAAAYVALLLVLIDFMVDRCEPAAGHSVCVSGVATDMVGSFSSGWDHVFPFSAMHDRVDVVAKSRFWPVLEAWAYVFCTDEAPPRQSEILRCYFFDLQVCRVVRASVFAGGFVGIPAAVVGAFAAAAIGCATIVLCLLGLLVAVIIVVAAMLAAALIAGQIARARSGDPVPRTMSGAVITLGNYLSVSGNMVQRGYDHGANVLYWVSSANRHTTMPVPPPYSYCDVDALPMDSCPP